MKKIKFIVLLLLATAVFPACDKPYSDYEAEEDSGKVVVDGSKDESDTGSGDTGSDGKDEGSDLGDEGKTESGGDEEDLNVDGVVGVETFIGTPIVNQVWLKGYIVGAATGANGKKRYRFESPFEYDTAILLADDPDTDDLEHVVSVCLTSCSKKIREALNLVDHPENKGKMLSVYGFREVYLGIPGIKKIDGYEFSE